MELATLFAQFREDLEAQRAQELLPGHRRAMDSIVRCRTPAAGEVMVRCTQCGQVEWHPSSCGHRSCPKCQNHDATRWLERQKAKLLPAQYFLLTFTLPAELRSLAWHHQRPVYDALFAAAIETIRAFTRDPRHLGAEIGCTAVLHTQSRRLTYHPHLHVVVPGGGVVRKGRRWKRLRHRFLAYGSALAQVFRGKLYREIEARGLEMPPQLPKQWVVDCRRIGRGDKALEYLSRYLYRGVISEASILSERDGMVTFRYTKGGSKLTRTLTLPATEFLWRILQHVLPRGFHRVRDYGLLHHSARIRLQTIQLLMGVRIEPPPPAERRRFACSACGAPMQVVRVVRQDVLLRIRPPCPAPREGLAC